MIEVSSNGFNTYHMNNVEREYIQEYTDIHLLHESSHHMNEQSNHGSASYFLDSIFRYHRK